MAFFSPAMQKLLEAQQGVIKPINANGQVGTVQPEGATLFPNPSPFDGLPTQGPPTEAKGPGRPEFEQQQQEGGLFSKINKGLEGYLNRPLTRFGLNLLANNKGNTFENIGRAGLGTSQQIFGRGQIGVQNQLDQDKLDQQQGQFDERQSMLREQLDATEAYRQNRLDMDERHLDMGIGSKDNVQSTFQGDNGNQFIVRRNGTVEDTGISWNSKNRLTTLADGSVHAIDTSDPTNVTQVITPDQATESKINSAKGDAQADAVVSLPGAQEKLNNALTHIETMLNHNGLAEAQGAKGASSFFGLKEAPIAGTRAANFNGLREQLEGKVFLEAYQQLKGGGPITDVEGDKAQAAMTRMLNPDISEDEWKAAASEFQAALQRGFAILESQANGEFAGFSIARD